VANLAISRWQAALVLLKERRTRLDISPYPITVSGASSFSGLTAVVSVHAISLLRAVAKGRGCSIAALANSALENWLKGKNA
jgi:hypothetical protein